MIRTILLAAAVILTGCDNDSASEQVVAGVKCTTMEQVRSTAGDTSTCTLCSVTDAPASADGKANSAARMSLPATGAGTVALRATAGDGVSFAAGNVAGVILDFSHGYNTVEMTGRTYLDGRLVETFYPLEGADVASGDIPGGLPGQDTNARAAQFYPFPTNAAFDAVEISFNRAQSGYETSAAVYEFCSSSNE